MTLDRLAKPARDRRDEVLEVAQSHDGRLRRDVEALGERRQRLAEHLHDHGVLLALLVAREQLVGQRRIAVRVGRRAASSRPWRPS